MEAASTSISSESNVNDADASESRNTDMENSTSKVSVLPIKVEKQTENLQLSNPCVVCSEEEKKLACIPCGHLVACLSCGNSLRVCPMCRREIEAFVRIYL